MLKNLIRKWLQQVLGFERYLFWFALVQITRQRVLKFDKEFLQFNNMIRADGAILDIGANIGITAVLLARRHRNATIYAFEPVPENCKTLQRVIAFYRLNNVVILPMALGKESGYLDMVIPEIGGARMQGLSHVAETGTEIHGKLAGHTFSVPVEKLDNVSSFEALSHISAIKIDVENYELFVLQGGSALLQKHRPLVFCELWDNERRQSCIGLMHEMKYRVAVYYQKELVAFTGQQSLNYFFIPEDPSPEAGNRMN
ncbi:MAG: FkbM family methyltransferase [Bacteroidota bacterium]